MNALPARRRGREEEEKGERKRNREEVRGSIHESRLRRLVAGWRQEFLPKAGHFQEDQGEEKRKWAKEEESGDIDQETVSRRGVWKKKKFS